MNKEEIIEKIKQNLADTSSNGAELADLLGDYLNYIGLEMVSKEAKKAYSDILGLLLDIGIKYLMVFDKIEALKENGPRSN